MPRVSPGRSDASEVAFYVVPPLMCMAVALTLADRHRLRLLAFYVAASLVMGGAITFIRRRREHAERAETPHYRKAVHRVGAIGLVVAVTGFLFALAWGYGAFVDEDYAPSLVFAATIFTAGTTLPALATSGSRARP